MEVFRVKAQPEGRQLIKPEGLPGAAEVPGGADLCKAVSERAQPRAPGI